jgi:hypothetical protein
VVSSTAQLFSPIYRPFAPDVSFFILVALEAFWDTFCPLNSFLSKSLQTPHVLSWPVEMALVFLNAFIGSALLHFLQIYVSPLYLVCASTLADSSSSCFLSSVISIIACPALVWCVRF